MKDRVVIERNSSKARARRPLLTIDAFSARYPHRQVGLRSDSPHVYSDSKGRSMASFQRVEQETVRDFGDTVSKSVSRAQNLPECGPSLAVEASLSELDLVRYSAVWWRRDQMSCVDPQGSGERRDL